MKQLLKFLFSLILTFSTVCNVFGADVSFAKADFSWTGTQSSGNPISATKNGVTISCTAANIPSGGYVVFNKNATLTISSTAGNITAIDFTCTTSDYTGNMTDVTGISTTSWSRTVSCTGNKTTVRVSSIVVTIAGSAPTTYTVTYNANGGTGSTTDSNSPYNSGATVTVKPNAFTAPSGKQFDHWNTSSTDNGTSYNPGTTFTISSDITLYAIWKDLPMDCDGTLYDFSSISGFSSWGTSYSLHNVVYTNDSVVFASANHQTSTITDIPVTKGNDVIVKARNGENIVSCNLICRQWTDKAQTIELWYSTDYGTTYTTTNVTSSTFSIAYDNFPSNVNVIKFSFSSQSNQIGIDKLCIEHGEVVPIPITSISLKSRDTLRINEVDSLIPTITPANANTGIEWTTSNSDIVTVVNGKITGIAEGEATITVKSTLDNSISASCIVTVLGKANIDIAKWDTCGVYINIDNFEAASAIIENQNTKLTVENLATELFFSKYFEAQGNIKLLGIYNGTKSDIDLTNYKIKIAQGKKQTSWNKILDLSGLTSISAQSEIVLISYNVKDSTITNCIIERNPDGLSYVRVQDGGVVDGLLDFNGDDAIGLFKNTTLIDIIGAGTASAANVSGLSTDSAVYDNGVLIQDQYCWKNSTCDSIGGNSHNYTLATNLCLLIRKADVHSGDTAVKYNKTNFVTLPTEWIGKRVLKDNTSTCHNFDYVGTFDYGNYYAQYDTIISEFTLPAVEEDGTYKITIHQLDTLSCTNLKIVVKDENGKEAYEVFKIPIMVSEDTLTNSILFTKEGKDCATCDVVVLANKTLTAAGTRTNRNVKVYEGGKLSIPSGTTYNLNSLSLRQTNNIMSYLSLGGTLNLSGDSSLYYDLYTDPSDWRWIALPGTFDIRNITLSNGKSAGSHRVDYWFKIYDGGKRAREQRNGWISVSNNKVFTPGEGFIFGSAGDGTVKKEYRFKFSNDLLDDEMSNKTIAWDSLKSWGCADSELRPNHKGWNLIGNPFMTLLNTEIYQPIRIGHLIKDMSTGSWNGQWLVDPTETDERLRYIIVKAAPGEPTDDGSYRQELLDEVVLKPFQCFFIQLGGTTETTHDITMKASSKRSIIRRMPAYDEEPNEELFLRVYVGEEKTGMFISNKFSEEYEPGDDFESRRAIYQNIGGYKLLYSAINDSIIENGVSVTSPSGLLRLDDKVIKDNFEEIFALYNDTWYDLLHGDEVEIEGGFKLYAKRKIKENVATDIENVVTDENLQIYDMLGRCIGTTDSPTNAKLQNGIYVLKNNSGIVKIIK